MPAATPPFLPQIGGDIQAPPNQPGAPITRPSFLTGFLASLGPALAYGLQPQPGMPFGGGLGPALQGIQLHEQQGLENARQAWQLRQQAQQQQSEQAFRQAQMQHLGAEESRASQLFPLQLEQEQMGVQQKQGLINLANNPAEIDRVIQSMVGNLGVTNPNEKAMLSPAIEEFKTNLRLGKFEPKTVGDAANKIAEGRIRAQQSLADTTAFKTWRDAFIKENGREPNTKEVTAFQNSGVGMRIVGMENLRQDNYLDTTTGQVSTATAGEFAAANKAEPGRYVKYNGQVSNALKGQSLINDIRDGIQQMRQAVNDPNFKLSSQGRALMSLASKTPDSALGVVTSGLASQSLSDAEQNYIIAHATLLERAMSLRGLQGQGAGSDQQRRAIADMLPGLATGDKNMANKQLATLENNVSNVAGAIPKVGKSSQKSAGTPQNSSLADQLYEKYRGKQ
jgi:hypothetical protein